MISISDNLLFNDSRLTNVLSAHLQSVNEEVNKIPKDQFMVSSDDDLTAHLLSKMAVNAIVLHEEEASQEVEETQIDARKYPDRYVSDRSRPLFIPGTKVTIAIPFEGDEKLWRLKPSSYMLGIDPHGEIQSSKHNKPGYVRLAYEQPADSPNKVINDMYLKQLSLIKQYLQFQEGDIKQCNAQLEPLIRKAIQDRRDRLEKQNGLVAMLGIPLKRKDGVPEISPIQLEKKLIHPLPPPPKSGFQPEPGIIEVDYENILANIRHIGNTFEATSATYAVHNEEELRDFFLASLNGYYGGRATGETFRKTGKTDIRIEDQNRSAFIAECKIWSGPKTVNEAVNQLLGYLTWRDCKSALIIFNKHNAKFSELIEKTPAIIRGHPRLYKELGEKGKGEWRYILTTQDDDARRITVHVFIFDLYVAKKNI